MGHLSASADGCHIWGVNWHGEVWYRNGIHGDWERIGGSCQRVYVSADGSNVFGIDSGDNIYWREGFEGYWAWIPGKLKQICCSPDGSKVVGVNGNADVWTFRSSAWSWDAMDCDPGEDIKVHSVVQGQ